MELLLYLPRNLVVGKSHPQRIRHYYTKADQTISKSYFGLVPNNRNDDNNTMDGMMMPGAGGAGFPQPGGGPPEEKDDGRMVDLSSKIDNSECFARNEAPGFPMSNLFIGDTRLGCKSDADEQLILHVAFQEFVKVRQTKRSRNWHRVLRYGAMEQISV